MTQYTKYPNQIDSSTELPIATDNVTPVKAEVVNRLQNAILAIENELGTNPSGVYSAVKDRLNQFDSVIDEIIATGGIVGPTGPSGETAGIYGDGVDGVVNIVGPITLTDDIYGTIISITGLVHPNGFRIMGTISITINASGIIDVSGENGSADGTAGNSSENGRAGAAGAGHGDGSNHSANIFFGGVGGNGGASINGIGGVTNSSLSHRAPRDLPTIYFMGHTVLSLQLGTFGLGGSSGASGNGSYTSPGAGGGGGIFLMVAPIIINNGLIKAAGGNGGAAAGTNTGGSGGGGGGIIYYITHAYSGSGTFNVSGGLGSAGTGTASAGTNGHAGSAILISV